MARRNLWKDDKVLPGAKTLFIFVGDASGVVYVSNRGGCSVSSLDRRRQHHETSQRGKRNAATLSSGQKIRYRIAANALGYFSHLSTPSSLGSHWPPRPVVKVNMEAGCFRVMSPLGGDGFSCFRPPPLAPAQI